MRDVLALLSREAPKLGSSFRQAVENGDCKGARRAAHTLKSNCRQFDLIAWSEFAESLEELAQTASPTELQAFVPAVVEACNAIADWAEKLLES